jgi:hypothetical protein
VGWLEVIDRRMQDYVSSCHERAVVGNTELVPIAERPSERSRRHGARRGATHWLDLYDFCAEVGEETTAKFAHLDRAIEYAKPVQRQAPLVGLQVLLYAAAEAHVPVNFGGRFSAKALRPSLASLLRVTMPA